MHRPEHAHCLLDQTSARVLVRHVGLDDLGCATLVVDHLLGLQGPFEIVVHQCDLGTVPGEKDGGCSSVAYLAF